MHGRRLVVLTLAMLLLSVWSSGLASAMESSTSSASQQADFKASSTLFDTFSNVHESTYELRSESGLIHSPYGSFDPLIHPLPLGPESVYDSFALERTRFALVQSLPPSLGLIALATSTCPQPSEGFGMSAVPMSVAELMRIALIKSDRGSVIPASVRRCWRNMVTAPAATAVAIDEPLSVM